MRGGAVARPDVSDGDERFANLPDALNAAVPLARIFAVGPYEFSNGEALVSAVPPNDGGLAVLASHAWKCLLDLRMCRKTEHL